MDVARRSAFMPSPGDSDGANRGVQSRRSDPLSSVLPSRMLSQSQNGKESARPSQTIFVGCRVAYYGFGNWTRPAISMQGVGLLDLTFDDLPNASFST